MLLRILVVKDISISSITVFLEPSKVNYFTTKYFNGQLFFLIIHFYFLHTPLDGFAVCGLTYLVCLFSHILIIPYQISVKLQYSFLYAYSISVAIFKLILLLNIPPQHTLHSRVKDSITHNSIITWYQIIRQDLYVNVNFASTFL